MRSRAAPVLILLTLAAVAPQAAAHGEVEPPPTAYPGDPTLPPPPHHEVLLWKRNVTPRTLHVRVGDHVNFTNNGTGQLHTARAVNSAFTSPDLLPGESWEWVPEIPGTFNYTCRFIADMKGTIVVAPPPAPNSPPEAAIVWPEDGERVKGVIRIEGKADDPDSDPFRVRMRIDGGPWAYVKPGFNWSATWNTTVVANGAHVLEAQTVDIAGETSPIAAVTVHVANPAPPTVGRPSVVITKPLPDSRISGEITIEGVASGATKSATRLLVKVRIDDGPWKDVPGGQHWSTTWDSRGVRDGPHSIEAVAVEEGEVSPLASVNVLVLNAGTAQVSVRILTPSERDRVDGITVIRGTAEDPDGRPLRVLLRADGGEWRPANGTSQWEFVWNSSTVANGIHLIEAVAHAGTRTSALAKISLFVENGAPFERPRVNVTSLAENQRLAGVVLVQGTASSPLDAPPTVQVRVDDYKWQNVSGSAVWAYTLNTTALTNGVHTLRARAVDARGTSEIAAVRFLVANAPTGTSESEFREPALVERTPREEESRETPLAGAASVAGAIAALAVTTRGWRRRR